MSRSDFNFLESTSTAKPQARQWSAWSFFWVIFLGVLLANFVSGCLTTLYIKQEIKVILRELP